MEVSLHDPSLGDPAGTALDLGCYPYVVTQLQIGSPAVRPVTRNRALADGAFDDTRFVGGRAVTVTVRLNNRGINGRGGCAPGGVSDMQALIDAVVPYMSPRLRPTLTYQLPGSAAVRSMVVRGESWPVAVDGPKYPVLPLSWVCPSGEIFSGAAGEMVCESIVPSADVEAGRHYGLPGGFADSQFGPYYTNTLGSVDRKYPASLPVGGRIIRNDGNAPAHWTLTIFGVVTNPTVSINGYVVRFNRNGGLALTAGNSVVLDSRDRTVLLNGDPALSRYDKTNYDEWTWDQLRLAPGDNIVLFAGTGLGAAATAQLCWQPTWLA